VISYELDVRGLIPGKDKRYVSIPQRSQRLWCPHSIVYSGYRIKRRSEELTTDLHVLLWLRIAELYLQTRPAYASVPTPQGICNAEVSVKR
jgi:hypothetical protein